MSPSPITRRSAPSHPPHDDPIAELSGTAPSFFHGLPVLGLDANEAELEIANAVAAREPLVKGFAVGRGRVTGCGVGGEDRSGDPHPDSCRQAQRHQSSG
ncbi:MAG: DUF2090 domain-containing protein [Alphaproteobacteria bacterium]|nr:DUF2090 domain-containing protein [Alphaproteobacteria bacterium]